MNMTPAAIRQRIAELEAIKSAAASSDAHNADTAWAVAEGEIRELRAMLAQVEEAA